MITLEAGEINCFSHLQCDQITGRLVGRLVGPVPNHCLSVTLVLLFLPANLISKTGSGLGNRATSVKDAKKDVGPAFKRYSARTHRKSVAAKSKTKLHEKQSCCHYEQEKTPKVSLLQRTCLRPLSPSYPPESNPIPADTSLLR